MVKSTSARGVMAVVLLLGALVGVVDASPAAAQQPSPDEPTTAGPTPVFEWAPTADPSVHVPGPISDPAIVEGLWTIGFFELPAAVAYEGSTIAGATVTQVLAELRAVEVEAPVSLRLDEALLGADPNIRYVEHVYRGEPAVFTPNDPYFTSTQYAPQQIGAPSAWMFTRGDADAAVCVADTGLVAAHEDIEAGRRVGWRDFSGNPPAAVPVDDDGHGTHVAGIAAATVNNGTGIAGMGNVGLYAVRVLPGDSFTLANGINWCVDNTIGRTVINLSVAFPPVQVLEDAVDRAIASGRIVVASAGNSDTPNAMCGQAYPSICYPARYGGVIAVTCTTQAEGFCSYSRYGTHVTLSAPGDNIWSLSTDLLSPYRSMSGTSMAAPHVAGALALSWSRHVTMTGAQLRARAVETARDLGPSGFDQEFGEGVVDAKCLVERTPYAPRNPGATPGAGQITVDWDGPKFACNHPIQSYAVYRATSSGGTYSRIATLGSSARSYTDATLGNGVTRWYRVAATNDIGEGLDSDKVSATTFTVPGAPTSPAAQPGTAIGAIVVTWGAPASNGGTAVTGYRVYRSTTAGGTGSLVATLGSSARSWTDTGRTVGTTYYYRVSARNAIGEGARSAEVCSKPFPSAPGVC